MAVATVEDVQNRFARELDEDEQRVVSTRLDDAERMLSQRVDVDTLDPELVAQVEADMVLRLVRNPEGISQETDGNYSYSLSYAVASGRLSVLNEEWELLGVSSGVSVLAPHIHRVGGLW